MVSVVINKKLALPWDMFRPFRLMTLSPMFPCVFDFFIFLLGESKKRPGLKGYCSSSI